MSGNVLLQRTNRAAWITIDRPGAKNALTKPMLATLTDIVTGLANDTTVDVVVLRGTGTDFCAGADMGDIASILEAGPVQRGQAFEQAMQDRIQPLAQALLTLRQPIVASARGHTVGIGVLFLLAADLVVASETTKLTLPQVKLGHTVDHGESWLLPRKVGQARAMQMCLLGERMSATDAERFGLANWVSSDAELESRTQSVVDALLAVAPVALANTKALLKSSAGASLKEQFEAEVQSASLCAATADFVEAISAQVQRRAPVFTGT